MWGLRSQRRAQEGVSVTLLTSIPSPPHPPFTPTTPCVLGFGPKRCTVPQFLMCEGCLLPVHLEHL